MLQRRSAFVLGTAFFAATFLLPSMPTMSADPPAKPPVTRKSDHVDAYHGASIADPYRWLEDDNSDETKAWVQEQNRATFAFLEKIPQRKWIAKRLEKLWDYERLAVPEKRGEIYFFEHNTGLQQQSVLFVAPAFDAAAASGSRRLLLDPNTLSKDGTVAVSGTEISHDGRLLAYGLARAGSDWNEWRVRDVSTGTDLPDELHWIKFSGASWDARNEGFYYSRYDEPEEAKKLQGTNFNQQLYYHKLGAPQSQDKLIYARPDHKEWGFRGFVTEDGQFLVITVWRSTERKNLVFYQELAKPDAPIVELLDEWEAAYSYLGNDGRLFYFETDRDAPRGRVVAIDLDRPAAENWREIVPQAEETLQSVSLVGDRFFASYLQDAHSLVRVFDTSGENLGDVPLAGIGSVAGFPGRRADKETYFSFSGFTSPSTIFRYDLASGETKEVWRPATGFDPEKFETRQVFYKGKDGTRVPMFITAKKGIKLDGNNPMLLYGYGGFDNAITPAFSISMTVWLEMGGVYAVANLRGGGEYGKDWHEAGMKEKKQNVFDDFLAAAEWLIENRYASRERLAVTGRSNGGLLVGACMTQRPDLFAAAIPEVGVMDMLRYHKFTIGWAWVSEYGSSDDAEEFQTLLAYSPLHNIKPGVKYPATLVTTADHDDRVVPAHSFKFAAALQAAHAGDAPCLIRIETSAGHGAGTPTAKAIAVAADRLAFLAHILKVPVPE